MKSLLVLLMLVLLASCSDRYQHAKDFGPASPTAQTHATEPVPHSEPLSVTGNQRNYRVMGETYWVQLNPEQNLQERGIASWYGMKFHGHATANGEIYDVYQYTAAHKTLPLPSYVKVTREDNGKSVVVRVNDRGPFHEGRIIDLSYVAAKRIGLDKDGTTPVTMTLLAAPQRHSERWIQVSALSSSEAAWRQRADIARLIEPANWPVTVQVREQNGTRLHKVRIGPIPSLQGLEDTLKVLEQNNMTNTSVLAAHQL